MSDIKLANDWTPTADLWCRKQPHYQPTEPQPLPTVVFYYPTYLALHKIFAVIWDRTRKKLPLNQNLKTALLFNLPRHHYMFLSR